MTGPETTNSIKRKVITVSDPQKHHQEFDRGRSRAIDCDGTQVWRYRGRAYWGPLGRGVTLEDTKFAEDIADVLPEGNYEVEITIKYRRSPEPHA